MMAKIPRQHPAVKTAPHTEPASAGQKAQTPEQPQRTRDASWSDTPRQLRQRSQLAQLAADSTGSPAGTAPDALPNELRQGIESLSGLDMSGVRVHRNSARPAELQAHAFAQGREIHLAPGQEQHLPHEAWHVVQQAQGRVRPTLQMQGGTPVNGDPALEREADVMGARAKRTGQASVQRRPRGVRGPEAHRQAAAAFAPGLASPASELAVHQFVAQRMPGQSDAVVQRVLGGVPQAIKQFAAGMWQATSWESLADNLNFLVKLVTELIEAKGTAPKIVALGTAFIASTVAAYNSYQKGEWYKLVNHLTKALTSLAAMYFEYLGGGITAKVVIMLIDQVAKKLPDIVEVVKAGWSNVGQGVPDDHRDDDLQNLALV